MKKILIVEDNPSNAKLMKLILKPALFEVVLATDGEEALRAADEFKPDLILMDIQIPKIDGLEVTRKLRESESFKDTPIIALTAFAMGKDEKAGIDAGCNEYVTKPFNADKLLGVMEKYLD